MQDFDFDTWFEIFVNLVRAANYEGQVDKYSFEDCWMQGETPEFSAENFLKEMSE